MAQERRAGRFTNPGMDHWMEVRWTVRETKEGEPEPDIDADDYNK